ncbi:DUF819 family protein [Thalassotalea euphylliae]|uniref:DUF819 family protein n=1 Tax=Thalassotalea euphylliae TaxID=1655234 RepID=A0A3E0TPZ5_9GAMM|nr:DUF819 family protein [Thalassotalea euphylliae]REL26400.1 DUF819 family protein [Thalassotalea euphylliae]REL29948.1 DUF819 family protein [Thalassotalea euphylliae]
MTHNPLITNDAVVLGLLALILGTVFKTAHSSHPFWRKFYTYVPAVLLCYFIPSLLNTFGIADGHSSNVYYVASRYLLPACLVLLTISIDLKSIINLGPKALIMFLTGTLGIVIGGPIAILIMSALVPEAIGGHGPDAVWRGMTTVAGSWIGGSANQASMKEMFEVGGDIFSAMVTVDVIVANLWLAVLLFMAAKHKEIDAKTGADTSAIEELKVKVEEYQAQNSKTPQLNDYIRMIAIAFTITGFAHFCADFLGPYFGETFPWAKEFSLNSKFFWLVVIATTIGISLSFTRVREIEAYGASKVAQSFIYILIASIGLHMNILAIAETPIYFVIGAIWMLIHATLMLTVAKLIKAPLFYMAVGSQANVGGAASAPVVASAFHPSLAPVGVLLAVLGYGVGTYMAYLCGLLMQAASG